MSPAGIPMFYGATDPDTAFAETAAHSDRPGATAGAFMTSRPCLVVDFTRLLAVPSTFDPHGAACAGLCGSCTRSSRTSASHSTQATETKSTTCPPRS
jgi:hypothetical protein